MNQEAVLNQILTQLEEITVRIENLEIQNNTRTQDRARNIFERASRAFTSNRPTEVISAGDRVKITNHYKGQFGKEGTVTRVTEKRVFFIIDGTIEETFRIKKNVRRIPPNPGTAQS